MSRWIAVAVGALSLSALGGCAENVANRCPDTPAPRCLSGTICENDAARGCQVCRCQTPYQVPESQPPQGPPQPLPP